MWGAVPASPLGLSANSPRALVTYLTTQSAAVAAIESGERSLEEMESFLASGLSDLVPEEDA
jgi:hypothetical protein